ncbi:TPA: DUF4189 domain-containing protein [Neisseria subflava]|uniref:DUF4189 domain-containing protein n=1 Tax=unclassified Neisseria TaxID=2623750 RepID=UPI0025E69BE1|nr:DUF4189 domain-containing protein [uncultured Neisseria sp.]
MKKLAFILCMGLFPIFSFACSPGVGGGQSGDPHCMAPILANDPYYNGSMNQQQTPVIVHIPSKYGAVAMNMDTADVSGVLNQDSLSKAKKAALTQCRQGDSKAPCKIVTWVRNSCIAMAEGQINKQPDKSKSFFETKEKGKAEAAAMARYKADQTVKNCKILLPEGCSLP